MQIILWLGSPQHCGVRCPEAWEPLLSAEPSFQSRHPGFLTSCFSKNAYPCEAPLRSNMSLLCGDTRRRKPKQAQMSDRRRTPQRPEPLRLAPGTEEPGSTQTQQVRGHLRAPRRYILQHLPVLPDLRKGNSQTHGHITTPELSPVFLHAHMFYEPLSKTATGSPHVPLLPAPTGIPRGGHMHPTSTSEAVMDIRRKQDSLSKASFSLGCVPHLTHTDKKGFNL